jgi:phage gpG-like protein
MVRIKAIGVKELAKKLDRAARDLPRETKQKLGVAGVEEAKKSFTLQEDAYGRAWKPKAGGGSANINAPFKSRIRARILRRTVSIGASDKWAKQHQRGALVNPKSEVLKFKASSGFVFTKQVFIPARPYLPNSKARGMGLRWEKAMLRAAQEAFANQFR